MTDPGVEVVDAKRSVELLHAVAPVPLRLIEMLDLPDRLYVVSGDDLSLSSDPSASLAAVVQALCSCKPIPLEFCAYGLHLCTRASNVFCTLADRRRRIVVMHSVANVLSDHRSWESFMCAIEDTMAIATSMRALGENFDFVVNKESAIRIIRP